MSEHYTPVSTYNVDYHCDSCNLPVKYDHSRPVQMTNPPKYPHVCPNCERSYWLTVAYPTIRFSKN